MLPNFPGQGEEEEDEKCEKYNPSFPLLAGDHDKKNWSAKWLEISKFYDNEICYKQCTEYWAKDGIIKS